MALIINKLLESWEWYHAYCKIKSFTVEEVWVDDFGKIYKSELVIDCYNNQFKNYVFETLEITLDDLVEEDLTLHWLYEKLKTTEWFLNSIDA